MKPLSIEAIKQLKEDDWVWIKTNNSQYLRVNFSSENLCGETLCGIKTYYYADYGTKWAAYKNKEEADCKGELVMLPCQIHDVGYFVDTENKMIVEADVKEILIHNYTKKFATIQITFEQLEGRVLYNDFCKQMCLSEIYWDKEQAEQKLKELIGEL